MSKYDDENKVDEKFKCNKIDALILGCVIIGLILFVSSF